MPSNLQAINQELATKRTMGDKEYGQVLDALGSGVTGGVLADLEAQKADLEAFMAERDARVALDEARLGPLREVVSQMAEFARAQAAVLEPIAFDSHPSSTIGQKVGDASSHGIIETTHTHPDAVIYVAALRTMLFNLRAGMDIAMTPPPEQTAPVPK